MDGHSWRIEFFAVSNDSNAVSVEVKPACGTPAGALEAGFWFWQAQAQDRICVRLQFVPGTKIGVGIWWNRDDGNADIQLIFGLHARFVELGSLRGNGYNAPGLHQSGFGTLAVNVAVQALQSACAPELRVEGVLSNTDEIDLVEAERLRLEANRRAFWRRFGLDVVRRGTPEFDYLRGQVGDLHAVAHGLVAGQFARFVSLDQFERRPAAG